MRVVHAFPRARRRAPTIIALHSSAASGRQWQALAARLDSRAQVIGPDLAGHGTGRGWRDDAASIVETDVARVAQLAAGTPGGVHLVGHSYGGAIAMRVALAFPGRVRSLAVYEPVLFRLLGDVYGRRGPSAGVLDVAGAIRRDMRAGLVERAAARFVDFWSGAGTWASMPRERRVAVTLRMPAVAAQFPALWHDPVGLADYRALDLPVLLMCGASSPIAPRRIVELLSTAMPQAELQPMSAMAHLGPITHPNTVAQRIDAFLSSVEAIEVDAALGVAA